MATTEETGGSFLREAFPNQRLFGVALISAIGDFGADADTALTREREPETAQA